MMWSVLYVLFSYFSSHKALPDYDVIPDFTDYEEEYNFSRLVTNNDLLVRVERNEDNVTLITTLTHDDYLQETTIMNFVTKNAIIKPTHSSPIAVYEEDGLYSERIITKEKGNISDLISFMRQKLVSNIQEPTTYSDPTVENAHNYINVAGFRNNYIQPTTTGKDDVITTFDVEIEKARRLHTKAFMRATEDNFQMTMNYTEPSVLRCFPWPLCNLWNLVVDLITRTTPRTPAPYNFSRKLDIPALVDLLNYVAFDYENNFNLTNTFNKTLLRYDIPTCEPLPTTPIVPTTTPLSTINFNAAHLVAKCFVCGIKEEGIPRSSACADAFSGDFIPLVKVDPKARGQIASYRKYCRYLDVPNFMEIPEEPQSMFGRFTGGCSVRWADLTGVYTQRACRNRRRAVTGKHFASKRMAKLEMTLSDLDNGCIVSPMATLIPVSRGISLYARFHACVCTGSWCNRAELTQHWITIYYSFLFHRLLILISNIKR